MNTGTYVAQDFIAGIISPAFLEKRKLSRGAKHLYGVLCAFAGTNDHCWPSHKTLAERMSCSVSSVKTYLAQLVTEKLVRITKDPTRTIRSCVYYMLMPSEFAQSQPRAPKHASNDSARKAPQNRTRAQSQTMSAKGGVATVRVQTGSKHVSSGQNLSGQNMTGVQSESGYNLNLSEFKKRPPIAPRQGGSAQSSSELQSLALAQAQGVGGCFSSCAQGEHAREEQADTQKAKEASKLDGQSDFEAFYAMYPKKVGKYEAQKVWNRLHKQGRLPSADVLRHAVAQASDSRQWQKEEGRYIPLPANYLRGERWRDSADSPSLLASSLTASSPSPLTERDRVHRQRVDEEVQRVESKKEADKVLKEDLRPAFDSLRSHFRPTGTDTNHAPSLGFFVHLHKKGMMPQKEHIPVDAGERDFFDWLREYAREFSQARVL